MFDMFVQAVGTDHSNKKSSELTQNTNLHFPCSPILISILKTGCFRFNNNHNHGDHSDHRDEPDHDHHHGFHNNRRRSRDNPISELQ